MNDPEASQRCLEAINDVLAENRLQPWSDKHLGDASAGQCLITDFLDAKAIGPRRVAITVRMRDPLGNERDVTIRFGGTVIYVVPLLNLLEGPDAGGPMLCFSKRWRLEHGDWSLELPHGLVLEDDLGDFAEDPLASRSHRVLAETFGQDAVESLTAAKIYPIGTFKLKGEARPAEAYVLAATVLQSFARRKGDGEIVKFAWRGISQLLENGILTEPATLATLFRASRKFPPAKTK